MFNILFNYVSRSIIVLLVAMLSINYLPDNLFNEFPFEPKSQEPNDYESVIPQNWNTILSDGSPEFIQLNNILGPESIAISKDGLIYSGLADGRLIELNPAKKYQIRVVSRVKNSPNCHDNVATRAAECGRILQVRFLNETLYVLEANTGLYKVDIKSGSMSFVGPKPVSDVKLYNSFAQDPKEPNLVYITLSSTKWNVLDIIWAFLEQDPSGKVIALDIKSGKRVILMDNLRMPNGVEVDINRDRLLMSDTLASRIDLISLADVRTAFKNAKDGDTLTSIRMDVLIKLLPGNPDNIIVEGDLAYIALPLVKLNGKELSDNLSGMPNLRRAFGRFLYGLRVILEYVDRNLYKHPSIEAVYRELKCGHVQYRITQSDKAAVVEYNLATGATRLFGSSTFGYISEAVPDNKGNIYLGSFRSPFLVKQKMF